MLRLNLLLVAVALAAVQAGCTQCDTCDDFPTPCIGGNCGPRAFAPAAPSYEAPMVVPPGAPATAPTPPSGPSAFAPPTNQPALGPGTAPATGPDLSPPAPSSPEGATNPNP
jgi:hypothetical protein